MSLDLSSVRAKLARAEEHISALDKEAAAWLESRPYEFETEAHRDYTEFRLRLRVLERDCTRIGLAFGDCINNLRCALDHLMYAIAAQKVDAAGLRALSAMESFNFPIVEAAQQFARARKKLAVLGQPVLDAIESVQQYPCRNSEEASLMLTLRNLNNNDKHRRFHLGFGGIGPTMRIGYLGHPPDAFPVAVAHFGDARDGAEVITVTTSRPSPNIKFEIQLMVNVAIDYTIAGQPFRTSATGFARAAREHVKGVIDVVSDAAK